MEENLDKKLDELTNLVRAWIDAQKADACMGCVYLGQEDWKMPCAKCSRACKDYWKWKEGSDG